MNTSSVSSNIKFYSRFLLIVAGLGGLLYGVDVGIIAGALPYLQDTSGLSTQQISFVVAAVLLGSVISTLFAGLLADWMGRKLLMILSGILFVISIPVIALSHGYGPLVSGRLLQGISAGFIGVVVPLYLAECLSASSRGKGTGVFQWLLTLGIFAAALIAMIFSLQLAGIEKLGVAKHIFAFKDMAWRSIFWVSLPPGILFVIGAIVVSESPRWLFRKGNIEGARKALLRSRTPEQVEVELNEMRETAEMEKSKTSTVSEKVKESILKRKYVIPFILACIILACTQATGINSIIAFNTNILYQAGLSDKGAHWGYVIFTLLNFLFTIVALKLVDRKGRKFLLSVGTAGIIVSLVATGLLFHRTENGQTDYKAAFQSLANGQNSLTVKFDKALAEKIKLPADGGRDQQLTLVYSYGDFSTVEVSRLNDPVQKPIKIARDTIVPPKHIEKHLGISFNAGKIIAFFSNPLANYDKSLTAPLEIKKAAIGPVPSAANGWLTALFIYIFIAFYASGPGVCVWLALSELMPTRIRSNGMSIALLINQSVSTVIASVFLPVVGNYGYATMFFFWAGCTVIYFIVATFFLPETKGKTLEEIEEHFEGKKA